MSSSPLTLRTQQHLTHHRIKSVIRTPSHLSQASRIQISRASPSSTVALDPSNPVIQRWPNVWDVDPSPMNDDEITQQCIVRRTIIVASCAHQPNCVSSADGAMLIDTAAFKLQRFVPVEQRGLRVAQRKTESARVLHTVGIVGLWEVTHQLTHHQPECRPK